MGGERKGREGKGKRKTGGLDVGEVGWASSKGVDEQRCTGPSCPLLACPLCTKP